MGGFTKKNNHNHNHNQKYKKNAKGAESLKFQKVEGGF